MINIDYNTNCLLQVAWLIYRLLLNVQSAVFHLYSGREQVRLYIKAIYKWEKRLVVWINYCCLPLKQHGCRLGRKKSFSLLQRLQCPRSFSKSIKEVFSVQKTRNSSNTLPTVPCHITTRRSPIKRARTTALGDALNSSVGLNQYQVYKLKIMWEVIHSCYDVFF